MSQVELNTLAWEDREDRKVITPSSHTSHTSHTSPHSPSHNYRSLLSAKNLLPVFVYLTLGFQLFQLLLVCLLGLGVWALARRPVPTLVQLVGGESVRVAPVGSLERDPQAVQSFVGEVSSLLFNWSDQVSIVGDRGEQLSRDRGIAVSDKAKVATAERLLQNFGQQRQAGSLTFEGQAYRYQKDGERLTVTAKDGRGTILAFGDGQLQGNLSPADRQQFRALDRELARAIAVRQPPNPQAEMSLGD